MGNPETDEVTEALEEMVLELATEDDEDGAGPHCPTIEGTASGPLPIATKLVPQFLALARCKF